MAPDGSAGVRLAVIGVATNDRLPLELVQVAVVHIDDWQTASAPLVWTVRPNRLPLPGAMQRQGVRFDQVAQARPWVEVAEHVAEALTGRLPVAYNAPHVAHLLACHLPGWPAPRMADVRALARIAWPEMSLLDLPHLLIRAGIDPGLPTDNSPPGEARAAALIVLAAIASGDLRPEHVTGDQPP